MKYKKKKKKSRHLTIRMHRQDNVDPTPLLSKSNSNLSSALVNSSKRTNHVVFAAGAVAVAGIVFIMLYFLSVGAIKGPQFNADPSKIKPNRLKPGSSVSIISPASPYGIFIYFFVLT
jgi:hypothetical protein